MEPSPAALDAEELFARHGAWMRRFAAALAGAEGEDLVQDAWLTVLQARARTLAHPRAWLARVLENAARTRRRGTERRRAREQRAARPEPEPSAADLVARAELEQLAVRALLELPEPTRETLLLRFAHGLEPTEIARRQGVPAATVRSRLARGLEEVRRRLDRRHGARGAWLALLIGRRSATPETSAASAASQAALTAGGMVMGAKGLAVGAAVVVGLVWAVRSRSDPTESPLAKASAEAPALFADATARAGEGRAMLERARSSETGARVTLDEAGGGGPTGVTAAAALTVRVVWGRDGTRAGGLPVEARPSGIDFYSDGRWVVTDADGVARFDDVALGPLSVNVRRSARTQVELEAGEHEEITVRIPRGVDVHCRVLDERSNGVPDAEVWLLDSPYRCSVGRTAADGSLLVRDVPHEWMEIFARADGRRPSFLMPIAGNPGDRVEIELVLDGVGAVFAGSVRDASGAPIEGAEVLIGDEFFTSVRLPDGRDVSEAPAALLVTDARGRFEGRGLSPGSTRIKVRARGFAPLVPGQTAEEPMSPGSARAHVELVEGETTVLDVVLEPEARLTGVVTDGAGRPIVRAWVRAGPPMGPFLQNSTQTAEDGSFSLGSLPSGPCSASVTDEEDRSLGAMLTLEAGATTTWDPVLDDGGTVAGRVVDERGAPLERWHVAAVEPDALLHWMRTDTTDAEGAFRLTNCPRAGFVLALRSPDETFGDPVLVHEDFAVGDDDVLLTVWDDARPSAFLRGRVVAADGGALVTPSVFCVSARTGNGTRIVPGADGAFRFGPLRPATYSLVAEAEGMGTLRTERMTLAPRADVDVGDLELEPAGQVVVHATLAAPNMEAAGIAATLWQQDQRVDTLRFEGLEGRSLPLAPGRYELRPYGFRCRAEARTVDVRPGAITTAEVMYEPAAVRWLDLVVPEADPASLVDVRVRAEDGSDVSPISVPGRNASRFRVWVGGLQAGTYRFEAATDSGLTAEGSFTVVGLEEVEPIEIELR